MKVTIVVLTLLSLVGCTALQRRPEALTVQACGAYGVALSTAVQMRALGKLNAATIDKITAIDQKVTPICTQKTASSADIQAVLSAVSQVQELAK